MSSLGFLFKTLSPWPFSATAFCNKKLRGEVSTGARAELHALLDVAVPVLLLLGCGADDAAALPRGALLHHRPMAGKEFFVRFG